MWSFLVEHSSTWKMDLPMEVTCYERRLGLRDGGIHDDED